MCFDVISETACSRRCKLALCAFVWLLPTVGQLVLFQMSSLTKWISTFCTFVYFLPSVGDRVAPQVSWSTKWLTTFWASVVLHSTMGKHVPFQISSKTKWLVALDTIVSPFFVVGYHVHLQSSWSTKWLLAFWTNVNLVATVGGGKTRHLTLLVRGPLSAVAIFKLKDLKLSRAEAIATFTFQCLGWTFNWATISNFLCFCDLPNLFKNSLSV